jgi:hypothetical protein
MIDVSGIHGEEGMKETHGHKRLDLVVLAIRQEYYRG